MQKHFLKFVFVLAMVFTLTHTTRADVSEVESLRAENAQLKARVAELEKELARARQTSTELAQLAGVETPDESEQTLEARVKEVVDEKTGQTVMRTILSEFKTENSRGKHFLSLEFVKPASGDGKSVDGSIEARILTGATGSQYMQADHITITADGQAYDLPITSYDRTLRRAGDMRRRIDISDEELTFTLPGDVLEKLVKSSTLEGTLGNTKLTFTRDQILLMRAMQVRKADLVAQP
ncbi:MAG: hypothetical protein GC164_01375 [Phycisphaera sp.]|nr:hypothetical protein [Phycisphaera sp.]